MVTSGQNRQLISLETRIATALAQGSTVLDLSDLGLDALPKAIRALTQLRVLDISGNQLTALPDWLGDFIHLQLLNVAKNRLIALPKWLGNLGRLDRLDVWQNQLITLPESLSNLTELQSLVVSQNSLTELPEWLGKLTKLREIIAWDNELTSLPTGIGTLTKLEQLDLWHNKLTALPDSLGELSQLQQLDISRNQLKELPAWMDKFCHLQQLAMSQIGLTELPEWLSKLTQIEQLDISGNNLTKLPEWLGNFTHLIQINAANNNLVSLPIKLLDLTLLKSIYLHTNFMLNIPEEILGPTYHAVVKNNETPANPRLLLNYYFCSIQAMLPLNEAKLVLVGFGGVGKTSLLKRLIQNRFEPRESMTDGIAICDWPIAAKNGQVHVHVWDFGGQEIMHATHQFFLTRRSLYVVVLNGRQGREDADAEYWLNLIASFGGESPVIVVLNKIKEHPFDINQPALRLKFPMIRDVIATDCADPAEGRQKLLNAVHREIDALPGLRDAFPAAWFAIKDRLSSMPDNYLTFDHFRSICAEAGVRPHEEQNQLAEILHRLGVALNYRDDSRLHDLNILNPRWVTEGVYKILNHQRIAEQKGELTIRDVAAILDSTNYPRERHPFLLELMRKFELCFRFPDDDERYLIPQLLPKEQPEVASGFDTQSCLSFEYHYPTLLPEGLLPRFIVRTYVLSADEPRWRSGVILRFEGHRALVLGDPVERRVRIRVEGPATGRRRLLAVIRNEFDRIHAGYKFKPEPMIPVPGHADVVVRYDDMVVFETKGVREVPHVVGGDVLMLRVKAMLDGVDIEGARRTTDVRPSADRPLRAFVSYSHKNDRLRAELETHLRLLQRTGALQLWTDRRITAGSEWKGEIDENLERADLILLLISADFMQSDYCYDIELKRALERHEAKEARVVPIIVRKVAWNKAPFGKLQALPADGKVVDRGNGGPAARDAAWTAVAEGLERVLREIAKDPGERWGISTPGGGKRLAKPAAESSRRG